MNKTYQPFGLWPGLLSAQRMGQHNRLDDVQWDSDGKTLVWLENRKGVGVLVSQDDHQAPNDLRLDTSVRGLIGYGGGEFTLSSGGVIFIDQQGILQKCSSQRGNSSKIIPFSGKMASPAVSADGDWMIYVFSDGESDCLACAPIDGHQWPQILIKGADFFMQPVWHPSGRLIAWVEWDHPDMSWESGRVMLARLAGDSPHVRDKVKIAGGKHNPASQPRFSADGCWLSYIATDGEGQSLMLYHIESGQSKKIVTGEGFTLSEPAWVQGTHSYGWRSDSHALYYIRYALGFASCWFVDVETAQSTQIPLGPYTWLRQLSVSPRGDKFACIGSSWAIPERIITREDDEILIRCRSEIEDLDPASLSEPQSISWSSEDGMRVHGLYYPPKNPGYYCQGTPPLIVYVHTGPTSQRSATYEADTIFFTSRGFAWLSVNYRGSSGYGRSYQDALLGNWGVKDVEDAMSGARFLANEKLIDPAKMVILGSSAGGFTVLNSLIRYPGQYKAGVCLYGISNLFTLAQGPEKFERYYTQSLVGALPEAVQTYRERSPIFHVDRISQPIAIFQGGKDTVVLPDQSEEMVSILSLKGIPCLYTCYENEGHGFRNSDTITDYYTKTEKFLLQHVIY